MHGEDANGAWGPTSSAVLSLDRTGPAASGVTLVPPAANSAAVVVAALASDPANGSAPASNITGAELFIDAIEAAG